MGWAKGELKNMFLSIVKKLSDWEKKMIPVNVPGKSSSERVKVCVE